MTEDEAVQWIAEKLVELSSNLDSFSFGGDEALGETWAFTLTVTRDDKPRLKQLHAIRSKKITDAFPEQSRMCHNRHWGCGWMDQLLVQMLDEDGKATEAARAVAEAYIKELGRDKASCILDVAAQLQMQQGGIKSPRHTVEFAVA